MFDQKTLKTFLLKRNVDVDSTKWRIKCIFARTIYVALLLLYVPFFLLSVFVWLKQIAKFKAKERFGPKELNAGKLGVASRRHKIWDMSAVSPRDEVDFLVNRSYGYILRMCFWTPQELTLFLLNEQKIRLISDGHLAYVVLCTVFGHTVRWDKDRQMFRLQLSGLEQLQLFEGFYWDAREILVSEDGKKIIIIMLEGEEYHSDCSPDQRPNFNLAKLHAQVCLSFMGPGLSHNDVHFLFPSALTVMSKRHLDHKGVLFKLLSPHFRFTERINYQALKVQKATNNKRSRLDRLFFHWQPFPVTKEIFREGIAQKCKEYYLEKGATEVDEDSDVISSEGEENEILNRTSNGESVDAEKQDFTEIKSNSTKHRKIKRTHALFPPDYVTDKNLRKIPYLNFLGQYYEVIRKYVEDLAPFINRNEWKILSSSVAEYVPRFDKVGMVDAIASFILKVSVVHYCDHGTYTRYFAYPYACMSMRAPFESLDNEEAWKDIEDENPEFKRKDVMKDPMCLIKSQDVLRTRTFLNIFVDFIPNPKCNLYLPDTMYDFEDIGPKMAARMFKKRLQELDEKLRHTPNIISLPEAQPEEFRAEGMQMEPLCDIVRTVCY